METAEKVVYRIDSQDKIVFVNDVWHDFAVTNDAADFTVEKVLNRPIWNFVADYTTRHLYREALRLARARRLVSFEFRCDSADAKRLMKMSIFAKGDDVQFECEPISVEVRPKQSLLARDAPRDTDLIVICGWCKRVHIGQRIWQEIEHAVEALRIFEREKLPALSHGICETCYGRYFDKLRRQYG